MPLAPRDEDETEQIEKLGLGDLPENWLEIVERRIEELIPRAAARRKDDEDRKTRDEVFDRATLLTLWKFISNGAIETLDYPVSTGKEANVFHASAADGETLAVKIYRVNTTNFRSLIQYIQGDPRFGNVKHEFRDVVGVWAQKEYKNLQRYYQAGTRVPRPIAHRANIVLMEFIGGKGAPAPLLKDAPPEDPDAAWANVLEQYRLGFVKGGLVHGDLSEFNILNHDGELVIIDVSQAVLAEHPMARDLLKRDAKNLARYFTKLGVKGATPEAALATIAPPRNSAAGDTDKAKEPVSRRRR